jgi:hypothetical protein
MAVAPGGPAERHCLLLYPILSLGAMTLRWATAVEAGNTSTYNHSGMETEGREPDPQYWRREGIHARGSVRDP